MSMRASQQKLFFIRNSLVLKNCSFTPLYHKVDVVM